MKSFPVTDKNKITRSPSRGHYDHQSVQGILDAGFVCHVGFVENNTPMIIPMTYGRAGNTVYLHGASSSRIMNILSNNPMICITVTLIDGIVMARSMFDTSLNYRSVVLFGKVIPIKEEEKSAALKCISEQIVPGRWSEIREPKSNELKATAIIKVEIETGSAKVRTGPPDDDARDLNSPVWAGVIPLKLTAATPVADPSLQSEQPLPKSAYTILKKYS